MKQRLVLAAVAALCASTLTACGGGTKAYCDDLRAANKDFSSLDSADFSKFDEAISTMHKLADEAPDEVASDWKVLDGALNDLQDALKKAGLTMDDLSKMSSGQMPDNVYHQMGIIDLLPAGLEIEQPLKGDDAKAYPFLGTLTDASRQDARDDRFVAAFDIGQRYRPLHPKGPEPTPSFHIAYIARAISVGRFALPAADVVDMYAPAIHARTGMGQMTIGK